MHVARIDFYLLRCFVLICYFTYKNFVVNFTVLVDIDLRLLAFGSRRIGFDGDMLFYQPWLLKGKRVFRFKSKLFSKIQLIMFNTKVVLI